LCLPRGLQGAGVNIDPAPPRVGRGRAPLTTCRLEGSEDMVSRARKEGRETQGDGAELHEHILGLPTPPTFVPFLLPRILFA